MAKDELPRPPPRISKEPYITYWDLNRSEDLMIYGYRHRITDCDPFTHDFLTAQGIQVKPKEPEPEDMYGDYRNKVSQTIFVDNFSNNGNNCFSRLKR